MKKVVPFVFVSLTILLLVSCQKNEQFESNLPMTALTRVLSMSSQPSNMEFSKLIYYLDNDEENEFCYLEYSGIKTDGSNFNNQMIVYSEIDNNYQINYIVSQDYYLYPDIISTFETVQMNYNLKKEFTNDEIDGMIKQYFIINEL